VVVLQYRELACLMHSSHSNTWMLQS